LINSNSTKSEQVNFESVHIYTRLKGLITVSELNLLNVKNTNSK